MTHRDMIDSVFTSINIWGLDRDAWLARKLHGVGASESPIPFGEGYAGASVYSLWAEKRGHASEERWEDERLNIGTILEPALRTLFSRKAAMEVVDAPSLCVMRGRDHMIASLDAVAIDPDYGPCPLELKNVGEYHAVDWDGDNVPLRFQIQCQHQMAVTGTRRAYIVGLIGGNRLRYQTIERSDRFIDNALMPTIDWFWGMVQSGESPPVDGSEATAEAIKRLYPRSKDGFKRASEEATIACHELRRLKGAAKALETQIEELSNILKSEIGDAEGLINDQGEPLATWKTNAKAASRFDVKAFERDYPELHDKYMVAGAPNRPLLIKVK